ncbi:hypothetical protein [Chromobacterium violaceum]|uniref:hypothetical protein n=1 Tax=Chromobacterium violaceum TaxID=536 RepID=UPI001124CF09|nr:hypothetical protein [Chromobacterium violaceum]
MKAWKLFVNILAALFGLAIFFVIITTFKSSPPAAGGVADLEEASAVQVEKVSSAALADTGDAVFWQGLNDNLRHWSYIETPPVRGLPYQIASIADYRSDAREQKTNPVMKVLRWRDRGQWRYVAGFDLGRRAGVENGSFSCTPSCRIQLAIDGTPARAIDAFQYDADNPVLGGDGQIWLVDPAPLLSKINRAQTVSAVLPSVGQTYRPIYKVPGLRWQISSNSIVIAHETAPESTTSAPVANASAAN